jgi:DNA-binding NarL/FixJ family response regulator
MLQPGRAAAGKIRLILVDDQPIVRRGLRLRLTLEPDMIVVGEASNGIEAVSLVQQRAPEIVLMDVEMPEMDGISATAVMRARALQSIVIMLSIHDDVSMRARADSAGAAAFVCKNGEIEVLIATIRQVAEQKKA